VSKVTYDSVIKKLRQSRANIACEELVRLLTKLGYQVREGRRGNHRVFTLAALPNWPGGNFDCGHGRNPPVLPAYITNVAKILEQHQTEIERQ
jgi:hypothetical protein